MDFNDRMNEYNNVKTPEELIAFMDKYINYGIYGTDNKIYDSSNNELFQNACRTKWILSDYERLIRYGYGHCFDQVELERHWFSKNNYEFKTIFIWFLFDYDNNYPTHTYLVYKDKQSEKWCIFEHADFANRGIFKYDTLEDAINDQKQKHIKYTTNIGNKVSDYELSHIRIYDYHINKHGINMNEFIDNILLSKEIGVGYDSFFSK